MKIKFVYRVCPVFIFYVKDLKQNISGIANAFIIRIVSTYENDIGLLQHELTHVKQFYRQPIAHSFCYLLSKNYRFECEVEAYKNQILCHKKEEYKRIVVLYAKFLSGRYKLGKKIEECFERLKKEVGM